MDINNGISDSTWYYTPLVMDPVNPQILYTAGDFNIYKTINGGNQWTVSSAIPDIQILAIDKVNSNIIYASNRVWWKNTIAKIYRTVDGGINWKQITCPADDITGNYITDLESDPKKAGVLYATCFNYNPGRQLWKSLDTGNTWINITNNYPALPANSITINPHNTQHIYAGTDVGMYFSDDGGATWNDFNNNLPNVSISDIHYFDGDSTIRIGTHGRGYWLTKAVDPSITSVSDIFENSINDIKLFPNPSHDNITITYNITQKSNVSIKVYNQYGQEVKMLCNGIQESGKHAMEWSRQNLNGLPVSCGIYYVQLLVNNISKTVKLIVL